MKRVAVPLQREALLYILRTEESPFIDFISMGTYLEEQKNQNFVKQDAHAKNNSTFAM